MADDIVQSWNRRIEDMNAERAAYLAWDVMHVGARDIFFDGQRELFIDAFKIGWHTAKSEDA